MKLPLSNIFVTRWTEYVLQASVIKLGRSSWNTAFLSSTVQCFTQVWSQWKEPEYISTDKQTLLLKGFDIEMEGGKNLENTRRNMWASNFRDFPLHLVQSFSHQPWWMKYI